MKDKILVADDESSILEGIRALLEDDGYQIDVAADGKLAWQKLTEDVFPLLLVDLTIPGMNGIEILQKARGQGIETEVIIFTGKGSIATAVEAMRAGVYDYLTKPVSADRIRSLIPKAIEHYQLKVSHRDLEERIRHLTHFEDLIGQSAQMQEIYRMIDAVAATIANVVITGESGTGKELVARAIHKKSDRHEGPFIAVNCAALPRDILENELFGHEKGAFTGALSEKPGCFELAHRGTLFLDEIGEMAPETQSKILRALEERRYRRLGGKQEIEVDVRVVAATNRELKKAIEENRIREDLYYRLAVVEIDLPPLRNRVSDIPLLMQEFLDYFNKLNHKKIKGFTPACRELFMRYRWPGNVRELKNAIERAVVLCASDRIDVSDLPQRITSTVNTESKPIILPQGSKLAEAEKMIILQTLESANQNKTRTAKLLGISLKTLHNKLARYRTK